MMRWIKMPLIFFLPFLFTSGVFPQADTLREYKGIKYEYDCPSEPCNHPLVICVPGFTQHNFSPEFLILTNYFKEKKFHYLIMNPPQHGEKNGVCKGKLYSWGKNEVRLLTELVEFLKIKDKNHSEIHLLGFSIGGKIVLKFCANLPMELGNKITSVVAVAAPYRVGDINMRMSGDILNPWEGFISIIQAFDRSSLLRILYMVLPGMAYALLSNTASPANEIPMIKVPTLLLHGSDDWLTKSYHSKRLFNRASPEQPFSIVILKTRTHAEDMLSRGGSGLRKSFLKILDKWFDYAWYNRKCKDKESFNEGFHLQLKSGNCGENEILVKLVDQKSITQMSSPTYNDLNTNIWISAPDMNHSLFTANCTTILDGDKSSRFFFTFGSTANKRPIWNKIRVGLSFEKEASKNTISNGEVYASLYYPFGSFVWFRRITFIQGFTHSFKRQILSADFSLLVLDFRVNYGRFGPVDNGMKKDAFQVALDLPLISDYAGNYYLGIGYSRFIKKVPESFYRDNFKAYLFIGPKCKILQGRIQGNIQYEREKLFRKARDTWSAGISINLNER